MSFRRSRTKRYGQRNVYEELGFNVSPQKKKQPKRIPQWVINTFALIAVGAVTYALISVLIQLR